MISDRDYIADLFRRWMRGDALSLVERQSINQLPEVAEQFHPSTTVITVKDSKIGWASAFR